MARDYAKRQTQAKKPRKSSRRGKSAPVNWKLWVITILLIIGFIVFLNHLKHKRRQSKRWHRNHIPVVTLKPAPKKEKSTAESTPQFDFYTMLPREKVKILTTRATVQYYLQVSALQTYTAADRLKAGLALLGFDTYITQITKDDATLYQVRVGPYLTAAGAKADQQQMLKNKIASVLKQEKINGQS